MREETIGECRLILGDCREWLASVPPCFRVDAVVTDPPYGIGLSTDNLRFSGGKGESQRKLGKRRGPANGRPIVGDDENFDPAPLLIGDEQIIWGWHNFPDKLPRGACLIWIKRNDDAFGSFLSDAETAWFSRGHGVYCFRDLSNASIARERAHPTQKPLALMQWCLGFLPNAETILDPFMGSGTTGVACVKLGRKFIGVEIEERYFDIACRRIEAATREPRLPLAEPRMKQASLLEEGR